MTSLLEIELLSTAAESPWGNGITERHNVLLGQMMTKIVAETRCSKNSISLDPSYKEPSGHLPAQS